MNHQEAKLKIKEKIESLHSTLQNSISNSLSDSTSDFNIDLLKNNLINLYNLICDYQRLSNAEHTEEIIQEDPQILPEIEPVRETETHSDPQVSTVENQLLHTESITDDVSVYDIPEGFEITADEILTEEPKQTVEDFNPVQESSEHERITQHPQHQQDMNTQHSEPTKLIISDRFQKDASLIHGKFNTGDDEKSLGNRLQNNPVSDIRKAMGINDMFTFINELFLGNKPNFEDFLNQITTFSASSDILNFLQLTARENNWETKPSFNKFSDLIQRYAQSK